MVRRIEVEGWTARAVADAFAVSERTVRKWLARFRADHPAGLVAIGVAHLLVGRQPVETTLDERAVRQLAPA